MTLRQIKLLVLHKIYLRKNYWRKEVYQLPCTLKILECITGCVIGSLTRSELTDK